MPNRIIENLFYDDFLSVEKYIANIFGILKTNSHF